MKEFFKRQAVIPFETTFAFFCVYSGLAGILQFGAVNWGFREVLGNGLSTAFNLAYILAGASLYFGIGLARRNIEAFGVILIVMSLLVRSIALYQYAGFNTAFISVHIYSGAFSIACFVRLGFLLTGKSIVEADTLSTMFREIEKVKARSPSVLI